VGWVAAQIRLEFFGRSSSRGVKTGIGEIMIRHIVAVRLRKDVTPERKWALFAAIEALKTSVPNVLDYHGGPNVSVEPHVMHGFDDGFWFDFPDEAARDAYLAHPTHQAAGAALVEAAEGGIDGIVVMDFKL
jgi:hypothetical protein